ncbi:peptidoglycan-binding protein [Streptomyces sp. NPDC018029]|uniref:peptidoglycan-binding domain-containing protein n=1 Tax=Streptomyces sp. NPDC018029 TaxID=3365032 RepID=UPI0037BA5B81
MIDALDRTRLRSAEAAAAEDFDPLRIRPYVSLPDPDTATPTDRAADTAPLPAQPPPHPLPNADTPAPDAERDPAPGPTTPHENPARNRRLALVTGAGAAAAVVAGTVFAVGLFSAATDGPDRDRALPGDPVSAYADPTKPAPPSAKRSVSASLARTPSVTPSTPAVNLPPAPTPAHSASPTPSITPSTARATGSVGPSASPPPRKAADVTLRPGDKGPRVAELQGRLAQLYLYVGERDGVYTSRVAEAVARYQWARGLTEDTRGEYGRETRRSLEAETSEP